MVTLLIPAAPSSHHLHRISPSMARISPTDCVLLHANGFSGTFFHRNATTAMSFTSRGSSIEVTLSCPQRPLLPTILFVQCSGVDFTNEPPRIIRAVEDTILFSVLIGPRRDVSPCKFDYYIYRVGDIPTLQLLPPPLDNFIDEDAGLLRQGDDDFMVAALIATGKFGFYELHRYDSRTGEWSQVVVRLVEPQISFPFSITKNSIRLGYHLTSTVITIGGEGGRMGWVDLWRGILICDVLDSEPEVRGVPLPLPMDLLTCNNGLGADIGGCANPIRGIAVVDQCLRFVHLEANISTASGTTLHTDSCDSDEKTATFPDPVMSDWVIHTWSNSKMTASWEDWVEDCKARASRVMIPSKVKSKMLNSGLLTPKGANPARALQNLMVSHPAPGTDDGVVYLLAKLRFQDPKAFSIALDTRENVLIGSAEFATEKKCGAGIMYFPSNISKHIDSKARVLPNSNVDEDGYEESSLHEGTESVEYPTSKLQFSGFKFDDASVSSVGDASGSSSVIKSRLSTAWGCFEGSDCKTMPLQRFPQDVAGTIPKDDENVENYKDQLVILVPDFKSREKTKKTADLRLRAEMAEDSLSAPTVLIPPLSKLKDFLEQKGYKFQSSSDDLCEGAYVLVSKVVRLQETSNRHGSKILIEGLFGVAYQTIIEHVGEWLSPPDNQ